MNYLKFIAIACTATTLCACSTIDAIADFDWNRKGPSYAEQKRAQEAQEEQLKKLQSGMSSAEKKAIADTCRKKIVNNMNGGTASLNELIPALNDCEIKLSK
jgi:hypothetical protein